MNSRNSENHQIEANSRELLGQGHQRTRHKVLTNDTQLRIPQENTLKTPPRKSQERAPKMTKKGKWQRHNKALRNHAETFIHTMKVHTRSSLPPNHPSLFQDLTMKLSS
jgi:ligand-binding sensor domain-containing protein